MPSFSPLKRSRLARHDIVAAATKIDELDYALEGMGTRVLTVMRSSVLEVAGMLTDAKARLSLFRTHGVLARVVGASVSASPSPDPLYALTLAALMHMLAHDRTLLGDEELVEELALGLLRRLQADALLGASSSAEPGTSPTAPGLQDRMHRC